MRFILTMFLLCVLISGLMILAISFIGTPLHDEMQDYFVLGSGDKVATACFLNSNVENKVWVYLRQYNTHGKASLTAQLVNGNGIRLQTATLNYQPYMQLVGLQSGIKLTLLKAYYEHTNNVPTIQPTSILLNGGNDAKFIQLQSNPSPGVTATLNDTFMPPVDGKTYDIYTTTSGLTYRLAAKQIKSCAIY